MAYLQLSLARPRKHVSREVWNMREYGAATPPCWLLLLNMAKTFENVWEANVWEAKVSKVGWKVLGLSRGSDPTRLRL